jgi:hypothetical protein
VKDVGGQSVVELPEDPTVVGLGSDFPDYTQDHDASGQLIPEAAEANRKVFVELAGGSDLDCS